MEHLLLLHGALGAKDQLMPLAERLKNRYIIHVLNFNGHGGRVFSGPSFSIESFAGDAIEYLQEKNITQVNIFGYSMGGYVAIWLAKHHAGMIKKVITLATKFYWDESVAAKEVKMLDAETIQQKLPAFAQQLQERHSPNDWKDVLDKTRGLLLSLGQSNSLQLADYSGIQAPCLLLLGDKDKMITGKETEDVHAHLPHSQFQLLPDTAHPLEQVDMAMLATTVSRFLEHD
jgi:pimeloyl-ACP methyl ester carboxylesterase